MKLTVFEIEDWERSAFEQLSGRFKVSLVPDQLTAENAHSYSDSEVVSIFTHSLLDRSTLGVFHSLKLIATRSTGFDHIDMEFCRSNGILVSNVPFYGECTVAEHVFGLILTISHNLWNAIDRTRRGDFTQKGLQGFDLFGKTLGVIGTGKIGQCVIRIAGGFNMEVLATDSNPNKGLASALGFRYTGMDELLARSDIITLHVPAGEDTFHLISTDEFAKMKQGAVIINTARGSLIDIKALLKAISDGKISAAGLDVLPDEPAIREEAELMYSVFARYNLETLLADHILLRKRNVYITPHSAFNTREAVGRILDTTIENILGFTAGKPRNIVVG